MNTPLLPEREGWATRHMSLRTKIVLGNILALSLLLGALGVVIHYTVSAAILAAVDRDLAARVQPWESGGPPGGPGPPPSFPGPNGPPPPDRPRDHGGPGASDPYRPRLFDRDGHSLDPHHDQPLWDGAAFIRAKDEDRTLYSTITQNGESVRVISQPFPVQGPLRGVAQAAYPLSDLAPAFAGLDRALLTLIPVGLLGAGLAGAFLTGTVLRRVRRTTWAAARIDAQDFSRRLPVAGNDEFSELAETFNRLLSRQEDAFRQQQRLVEHQRRFTADASHELKTPLTIIKGNVSLARDAPPEVIPQALQEIDLAAETMACLVQDLLLLARSDDGQLGRHPIELLAREVLERAMASARPAVAAVRLQVEEEITVTGNQAELTRLMTNLLDNAARHTPVGGCITVGARRASQRVILSVADTGVGIAPEHLPHLGERFYRVDSARARLDGGTGLGLSICKAIAEAHGGTLTVQSQPGHGTTISVTLPAQPPLPN